MKKKNRIALKLILLGASLIGLLSSCIIFGGQTIYEDPEYVDFDPEAPPKDESKLEEQYGDMPYFEAGEMRLYYDLSVQNYVEDTSETHPSSPGKEPYEVAHPDFVEFFFSTMKARLLVARVDLYQSAADFAPQTITDLQVLIDGESEFGACVPELPLNEFYHECSHQQFVANPKRVKFGNGSGVRFVSVYGIHDLTPVDDSNLVYVFQGFTDDGRYYLKLIVEMIHSQLPGTGEIPPELYTQDAAAVQEYFAQFAETFNTSEKEFTPKLDWIDSVLAKLYVE